MKRNAIILGGLALVTSAILAVAQDAGTPPPQTSRSAPPADGGSRRGGSYADFRQRMADRMKTALKVSDEEWTVLQPLLENVQTKQRDAMGARGGFGGYGGGGRSNRGGGQGNPSADGKSSGGGGNQNGGDRPPRAGAAEADALRAAVENESSTNEDIQAKLAAVRDQRKKAEAELAQAREELRKVVTVRQEATLVSMGVLE